MNYRLIGPIGKLVCAFALALLLSGTPTGQEPVQVTYIANEGFMISSGDAKLLIDALHRGGNPIYDAPQEPLRERMESAQGEFEGVALILVSHRHADHFSAAAVARHLASNPRAKLISSPQVVEAVRDAAERDIRAEDAYPPSPGRQRFRLAGIELELFRLPHGSGRFASIQNLGQIFRVGGRTFLHIGDAEGMPENFSAQKLADEEIDFAFLPYWYLTYPEGAKVVREIIRPRHIIAMHIPPGEMHEQREKIRAAFPRAIVFESQGERRTF